MPAPVNEGNIIVGAGQLYKLFKGTVTAINGTGDTFTLSGTPTTPAFENGDIIRIMKTGDSAVDGEYTVDSYAADVITVTEDISSTTASSGILVSYSRGRTGLGGTDDGADVTIPKEFHDVQAAEAPVNLRKELTQVTPTLSTGLLESTLDNLLLSWLGNEDPSGTLNIATDGEVEELALSLVGKAPSGYSTRTYLFWRTVSVGDGGHQYTKGNNTVITTEFELLPVWDDDNEKWAFGHIADSA